MAHSAKPAPWKRSNVWVIGRGPVDSDAMTAISTAPAQTLTRADIVRLGGAGRAWEFLPIALKALRVEPDDDVVRLLLCANAASLGLRTLALEHLHALGEKRGSQRDARTLRSQIEGLGDDVIDRRTRIATLERNLGVLSERVAGLSAHLNGWIELDGGREWFRASDSNVVRRRGDAWEHLGDHVGAARRFVQAHLAAIKDVCPPIAIEGADPPWLLMELARATPPAADGYQARLTLIQADPMELLDGLAHADLSGLLAEERLQVFVGADGALRYAQNVRDRFETQISGIFVPLNCVRTRSQPAPDTIIGQAEADQRAEHQRLTASTRSIYESRDRAWWARRYEAALSGEGPALRVLVPTCRYSTYIQHASRDLVAALNGAGHRAELLIEPDSSSKMSSLAYLRAIERLEPDLVILINYTRAHLGELFPARLPFVCWVQDAMGHHYDARIGAAQTEFDFLVGHLAQELFEQFEYPRERTLEMPVVTSARTFHEGAVAPAAHRRFECEVAWVSHHSEDAAAMHARLKGEVGPDLAPILDSLRPEVESIALDPLAARTGERLRDATKRAAAGQGRDESRVVTNLFRLYARPLADRILRHETLHWAAEMADRRGWRLRVYGRGWASHPRFGRYAAGEVAHDDDLRACYQCASIHLHMTIGNLVHQRVMECALSGGMALCRLTDESIGMTTGVIRILASRTPVVQRELRDGETFVAFERDADPVGAALGAQLRNVGREVPELIWARESGVDSLRVKSVPLERRMDWLLVNLADTTFSSAPGLEALAERGVTDPEWRRRTSSAVAAQVRERLTDDAFVRRVIDLVHTSLGAAT